MPQFSKSFQPRFANGIYRDCKWCQGVGCVYCPTEADLEYKRQFPDGPKPIASFTHEELKTAEGPLAELCRDAMKLMDEHKKK